MNWLDQLRKTYDSNADAVGKTNGNAVLVPVGHLTMRAHITVHLDADGTFLRSHVEPSTEALTIIGATPESMSRSSAKAPHAVTDKLCYVAGDLGNHISQPKRFVEHHVAYCRLLAEFQEFAPEHMGLAAVRKYVERGTLAADLVADGSIYVDDAGILLKKWNGDEDDLPLLLQRLHGKEVDQTKAVVRWSVETPGVPQSRMWLDSSLWSLWVKFLAAKPGKRGFCVISGQEMTLANTHPKKIHPACNQGKLISSNDTANFTYRGIFSDADEACPIGFETSQKAHNALSWLIARQGRVVGSQCYVAWHPSGAGFSDLLVNPADSLFGDEEDLVDGRGDPRRDIGRLIAKKISGRFADIPPHAPEMSIMGIGAPSAGRLAVLMFRTFTRSQLQERLEAWYLTCHWGQHFGKGRSFYGTPSPGQIAETVCGANPKDGQKDKVVRRVMATILDGRPLPDSVLRSSFLSTLASSVRKNGPFRRNLGVTCAIFNHINKGGYSMALDTSNASRDYLFGRLIAYAHYMEQIALTLSHRKRQTNAAKRFRAFQRRPATTWQRLELCLSPYKRKLNAKRKGCLVNCEKAISGIVNRFNPADFTSDAPLGAEFLLGYHCQLEELWSNKEETQN